jgi:pimeloyl-ACP methyl ester carboxylesterase
MLLVPLLLAFLAGTTPSDPVARYVATAPAESLMVTMAGPTSGPPVVIIPGLISPAYAFRHVLPPLAEAGVHAVVIEPLGVGHSSHPGGNANYSHTAQATRIAAVMDTLGISHAVVMGHAVGTAISLRLATQRPDLVERLLLVEGGALESAAVPGVKNALKFAFLVRLFGGRGRVRKEVRKGLIGSSADSAWVTDSLILRYTDGAAGDMGGVLRALRGMQNAVEPDSLAPKLNSLTIPVRLLLGAGPRLDGNTGMSAGRIRSLQRRLPNFSLDSIAGSGLHMHEERPDVIVHELLTLVRQSHP